MARKARKPRAIKARPSQKLDALLANYESACDFADAVVSVVNEDVELAALFAAGVAAGAAAPKRRQVFYTTGDPDMMFLFSAVSEAELLARLRKNVE